MKAQYEKVVVTLYGPKALGEAKTPRLQRLVEAEGRGIWLDETNIKNGKNWWQHQLSNQHQSCLKYIRCEPTAKKHMETGCNWKTLPSTHCIVCKGNHRIWECRVF